MLRGRPLPSVERGPVPVSSPGRRAAGRVRAAGAVRGGGGFAICFQFLPVPGCVPRVPGGGVRIGRPGCRCRWGRRCTSPGGGGNSVRWTGASHVMHPCPALRPPAVALGCPVAGCVSAANTPGFSPPRTIPRMGASGKEVALNRGRDGIRFRYFASPVWAEVFTGSGPRPVITFFRQSGSGGVPQAGGESGQGGPVRMGGWGWAALRAGAAVGVVRGGGGFAICFQFLPVPGCVPRVPGGGVRTGRPGCRCRWALRCTSPAGGGNSVRWTGASHVMHSLSRTAAAGRCARLPGRWLRPSHSTRPLPPKMIPHPGKSRGTGRPRRQAERARYQAPLARPVWSGVVDHSEVGRYCQLRWGRARFPLPVGEWLAGYGRRDSEQLHEGVGPALFIGANVVG